MKHRKLAAIAKRSIDEDAKRILRALEEATRTRVYSQTIASMPPVSPRAWKSKG
jgi:hypothetical protein